MARLGTRHSFWEAGADGILVPTLLIVGRSNAGPFHGMGCVCVCAGVQQVLGGAESPWFNPQHLQVGFSDEI